jgi:C4-dicarboxylate transporter DctQ subunit
LLEQAVFMTALKKAYNALIDTMAIAAGATLVWLMVSVVGSVAMRNMGMQPFAWLFTSAEYGLLYMTMLGAPWLVREKGSCAYRIGHYVDLASCRA